MTIRRQYSLPNCTLILEGLSDNPTTGGAQLDARPLMTILVSAECYFSGREQPLRGGRDFFESLVRSVSRYAQEFLSQIHHPKLPGDKPEIVQLQKIPGKSLHRLTLPVTAEAVPVAAGIGMTSTPYTGIPQGAVPMQLDLTTVQLFDLVEAIDQFLADRRTLPDLKISLEPISRRYRKADEPIAKRAAPAAIGVTGLALSAAAFMLLPIPRESKPSTPQPNAKKTTAPTPKDSPSPIATPKPSPPIQKLSIQHTCAFCNGDFTETLIAIGKIGESCSRTWNIGLALVKMAQSSAISQLNQRPLMQPSKLPSSICSIRPLQAVFPKTNPLPSSEWFLTEKVSCKLVLGAGIRVNPV
jgi:hypothetical protein